MLSYECTLPSMTWCFDTGAFKHYQKNKGPHKMQGTYGSMLVIKMQISITDIYQLQIF
jgi:hypothetical protein